jgi:hypothetical protein
MREYKMQSQKKRIRVTLKDETQTGKFSGLFSESFRKARRTQPTWHRAAE